jgi:hypothetical protein
MELLDPIMETQSSDNIIKLLAQLLSKLASLIQFQEPKMWSNIASSVTGLYVLSIVRGGSR